MYVSLWLLFLFNHRIKTFSKPTPITDRCLDSPCSVFPTANVALGVLAGGHALGQQAPFWCGGTLLSLCGLLGLPGVRLYGSLNLVMLLHW